MKSLFVFILISLAGSCSEKSNFKKGIDRPSLAMKEMLDGRIWTTENLEIKFPGSYCQEDNITNCDHFGRLYTWEDARKACKNLGDNWRLPTNEEWHALAVAYGGINEQPRENGKSAYLSLIKGGTSGFNALLGGNREANGSFKRLDAHGFYWTATEYDTEEAWFYNFAKGPEIINRHTGDKRRAVSVRCIKKK